MQQQFGQVSAVTSGWAKKPELLEQKFLQAQPTPSLKD